MTMNRNKCIAIIPARGGSKRIPKKNIKDFFGKPLIAYSIEVALASDLFEKVVVTTDDESIAKISNTGEIIGKKEGTGYLGYKKYKKAE